MDTSKVASTVHLAPLVKEAVRAETKRRNQVRAEDAQWPPVARWTMASTVEDILRKALNLGGEG